MLRKIFLAFVIAFVSLGPAQALTYRYEFVAPELQFIPNPWDPDERNPIYPSYKYWFELDLDLVPSGKQVSNFFGQIGQIDSFDINFDDGSAWSCATYECYFSAPKLRDLIKLSNFSPYGDNFYIRIGIDMNYNISVFSIWGGVVDLFYEDYDSNRSRARVFGENFAGPAGTWTRSVLAPVPVPATAFLTLGALLMLGGLRRRRKIRTG